MTSVKCTWFMQNFRIIIVSEKGSRELLFYRNFVLAHHPPLLVSDHHKANVWDRRHGAAVVGRSENCTQKLLQRFSFGEVCKKPANFRRAPNILFVRIWNSKGSTQSHTHQGCTLHSENLKENTSKTGKKFLLFWFLSTQGKDHNAI